MNVKELAEKVREGRRAGHTFASRELDGLLDAIDGAEEYPACKGAGGAVTEKGRCGCFDEDDISDCYQRFGTASGTVLFFADPKPEPTLREAAEAVLAKFGNDNKAPLIKLDRELDALQAALDREVEK